MFKRHIKTVYKIKQQPELLISESLHACYILAPSVNSSIGQVLPKSVFCFKNVRWKTNSSELVFIPLAII